MPANTVYSNFERLRCIRPNIKPQRKTPAPPSGESAPRTPQRRSSSSNSAGSTQEKTKAYRKFSPSGGAALPAVPAKRAKSAPRKDKSAQPLTNKQKKSSILTPSIARQTAVPHAVRPVPPAKRTERKDVSCHGEKINPPRRKQRRKQIKRHPKQHHLRRGAHRIFCFQHAASKCVSNETAQIRL